MKWDLSDRSYEGQFTLNFASFSLLSNKLDCVIYMLSMHSWFFFIYNFFHFTLLFFFKNTIISVTYLCEFFTGDRTQNSTSNLMLKTEKMMQIHYKKLLVYLRNLTHRIRSEIRNKQDKKMKNKQSLKKNETRMK